MSSILFLLPLIGWLNCATCAPSFDWSIPPYEWPLKDAADKYRVDTSRMRRRRNEAVEVWADTVVEHANAAMMAAADHGDWSLTWDMQDTPGMDKVHFERWPAIAKLATYRFRETASLTVDDRHDLDKFYSSAPETRGCFVWKLGWTMYEETLRRREAAVAWGQKMKGWAPELQPETRNLVLVAIGSAVARYVEAKVQEQDHLTIWLDALSPPRHHPMTAAIEACRLLHLLAAEPGSPVTFMSHMVDQRDHEYAILSVRL